MNAKNTETFVISKIDQYLDVGFTEKDDIINKIAEEFDMAKPIIRRIMRDMKIEMERKIRILDKQYLKDEKHV